MRGPSPQRRLPAPCDAKLRRAIRPRRRGVARAGVAPGGCASERRARAPRPLARTVGVRAHRAAAVGRVDPAAALGAAMPLVHGDAGSVAPRRNQPRTCRATLSASPGWLVVTLVALLAVGSSSHAGERYALIVTG